MLNLFQKKTKIIATYGPSCSDKAVVKSLILNGTDMFRINMSHNDDPDYIKDVIQTIRAVSADVKKHVGIFVDLQGPKIRVGDFSQGPINLKASDTVTLTSQDIDSTSTNIYVDYPHLADDVSLGDPVYIDDGKLKLAVVEIKELDVVCQVEVGGKVSNHKGVNFPKTRLSIPAFTDKDKRDAITGLSMEVDYVALSFVSKASDVQSFREFLKDQGYSDVKIISKIEKQQAVDNIKSIIEISDAIMVARGDLGVEVGVENVPKYQKQIIHECNFKIKPVIVATQMLDSMITSTTATRAEVSDIANAIYDSCDAVMLSGETAIGVNPANVVKVMAEICAASDNHADELKHQSSTIRKKIFETVNVATSICKAADQIADENNAKIILSFTSSGNTPLIASKINSSLPIIAPTDSHVVCQRLSLYKGVTPMMLPKMYSEIYRWTDMINIAIEQARQLKWVDTGDIIIVTAGIPIGKSNGINSIRIITV